MSWKIPNEETVDSEAQGGEKMKDREWTSLLPCKIGDNVWTIRSYGRMKTPKCGVVSEMYFIEGMRLCIVVKNVARGEWGKMVFATYEEAMAQIERSRYGVD